MSKNLKDILSGEKSIRLYLEFLQKNNHADLRILKNTKVSFFEPGLARSRLGDN
jgi:hypothetical protein